MMIRTIGHRFAILSLRSSPPNTYRFLEICILLLHQEDRESRLRESGEDC